MYTQHGEIDGIKWLSLYKGGRDFMLYVGSLKEEYTCNYEPIFGIDASDYAEMNEILEEMQNRIVSEGLEKDSLELDEIMANLEG